MGPVMLGIENGDACAADGNYGGSVNCRYAGSLKDSDSNKTLFRYDGQADGSTAAGSWFVRLFFSSARLASNKLSLALS